MTSVYYQLGEVMGVLTSILIVALMILGIVLWARNRKKREYSGFAIAGFILSFFGLFAFLGIIFSFIGLLATRNNKKKGFGFAIAGLIIAIIMFTVSLIAIFQGWY